VSDRLTLGLVGCVELIEALRAIAGTEA